MGEYILDEIPEEYWEAIAERRKTALDETSKENEQVIFWIGAFEAVAWQYCLENFTFCNSHSACKCQE